MEMFEFDCFCKTLESTFMESGNEEPVPSRASYLPRCWPLGLRYYINNIKLDQSSLVFIKINFPETRHEEKWGGTNLAQAFDRSLESFQNSSSLLASLITSFTEFTSNLVARASYLHIGRVVKKPPSWYQKGKKPLERGWIHEIIFLSC